MTGILTPSHISIALAHNGRGTDAPTHPEAVEYENKNPKKKNPTLMFTVWCCETPHGNDLFLGR